MRARLVVDTRQVGATAGETLFRLAESVGVHVPTSCREQGRCRECLVEIEIGGELLSAPSASESHLPPGFRLSCQTRIEATEGEVRCHTMRRGALQVVETASGLPRAVGQPADALHPALYTREGDRVLRDGVAVHAIEGPPLGLAIDLGTTTVVLRLFDLVSRVPVATQSFENPQRFGGSDVMARISYDTEHPGRLLRRVLTGYLRRAVAAFPCEPGSIVEIVVAGNSTMRDLLFGLDVHSLGQLPYRSITEHEVERGLRASTSLEVPATSLGLGTHPSARAYALPVLGSHVGGDAAACLLVSGLADSDRITMVMDIGTNTEVLLGNRDRVLVASCPAGPAFEGGGVSCGLPGLEGAIEGVTVDDAGRVAARVIGGGEPLGVCGSGLVDLLAELRRTGRMNAQGRLEDGNAFTVDADHGIALSESDISQLAQAKGANAAGARIVADRFGIELTDVDRFVLAGGFGRYVDIDAARRIGLIPDLPDEKITQVGNAALAGASMTLVAREPRDRIEELAAAVEHVELELHPAFFDFFVDGCQFEPFGGPSTRCARSG